MCVDWSRMISTETPAGSRGVTRSRLALAASMIATVLAPDWRRTSSTTVGNAVQARERALLLGAVFGAADVADADRRAVARGDHEVVELRGVGEAAHRAQRALVDVGRDVAAGQVGVLLLQRVADLGDRAAGRRRADRPRPRCSWRARGRRRSALRRRPAVRSSGTLTILSAISVSSRIDRLPDSAIDRLGALSLSCLTIIGGFDVVAAAGASPTARDRARPARRCRCRD